MTPAEVRASLVASLREAVLAGVVVADETTAADLAPVLGKDLATPRGCFHDGCDATTEAEEGGSHWCRWAT